MLFFGTPVDSDFRICINIYNLWHAEKFSECLGEKMDKNVPDFTDWDNRSNDLVSALKSKNIKKIALVGIIDNTFESFLSEAFLNAGIATITPEFKARAEIENSTSNDFIEAVLTRYSKLGAEAVISENPKIHDAACKCGICSQFIRNNK